jgi:acetyltransferase-like isoleucine patch superfamily enzyme
MNRFEKWETPVFDKDGWTKYGWRCQNFEKLKLGKCVDIGCFTYLNAAYGIEIGDCTQIGSHCSIYSVNTENGTKGSVFIGKNVLIGSNSLILPNAVIPDNSKIRAYSIIKEGKYVKKEI